MANANRRRLLISIEGGDGWGDGEAIRYTRARKCNCFYDPSFDGQSATSVV